MWQRCLQVLNLEGVVSSARVLVKCECCCGMPHPLSAPSVVILLRSRLRFSDAGEKLQQFLGPKSSLAPREPCDLFFNEKSQAIAILVVISRRSASPLRFGRRRGRLRQKIAAICDCDVWFSQPIPCCSCNYGQCCGVAMFLRVCRCLQEVFLLPNACQMAKQLQSAPSKLPTGLLPFQQLIRF